MARGSYNLLHARLSAHDDAQGRSVMAKLLIGSRRVV
jgi:hypothetical protein